jgi:hypothetical protein
MKPFIKQRLAAAVLLAAGSTGAIAQETTSAITGQITGPNGNPTSAVVRIVHIPSNTAAEVSTNANGRFSARGLRVGGPYRIVVDSSTYQDEAQEGIFLQLGETFNFSAVLGDGSIEEVTVLGDTSLLNNTATGPSSTFNLADIKSIPAINRDIKDIIRADPRIHLDPANGNAIQCGGSNPRFNSLTVDGVRLNDEFGLRQGGFPTNRVPFSLDSIDQVAVEFAPFDVQYSGFTACNINAVTKSGTNEWHGGVFYDYTDDSLTGDELEGDELNVADFDESRFGFHVGGPIIKDKLFFFASYEKLEGADTFDRGPSDSNTAEPVPDFTQADFDRIRQISQDVYGYDPGGIPTSFDNEDEKILVKLDWNISDTQRVALTYNYIDGFETVESDGDFDEFEFSNHLYEDGAELTSYSAQLFSNWTENFTTEFKIGYTDLDNRQESLDGGEFGEVQIDVGNSIVYLGNDDSRQSNDLNYENLNFKIAGTYYAGNHTFSGGFEYQDLEVFNLFIQESIGEYRFDSIDDFEDGLAARVTYENAVGTNNPADAAAEFSYQIGSAYGQYEYTFNNVDLTLLFGLRYDFYESDDTPTFNPNLSEAIGFSNADNLDGADLLQPRFGFQYNVDGNLELHGGLGLYSGGNPNVWLSNNYANTGITQVEYQVRGVDLNDLAFTGDGTPINNLPQAGIDFVANAPADGVVGRTNVLDPDFEVPSEWKINLGASLDVGNGFVLQTDFIHTEKQDSAIVVDNALAQTGTTFDGRPIYESRFTDPDAPSFRADQIFELTNVDGNSGSSSIISLNLSKQYNNGFSFSVGYAGTRSEEVTAMASSVAFSNFTNTAITDLNDPGVATSNFETQHRFTLRLAYETAFIEDYQTKFSLFGVSSQNRSYSYSFGSRDFLGDPVGNRNLLYVPTGLDDANVNFGADFDTDAFFSFVDRVGLERGEISGRNSIEGSWWTRFDLRIDQELPGFTPETRSNVFLVVENFGNLINDDWGVLYQAPFPQIRQAVDATYDESTDTYTFNEFLNPRGEIREREGSLWEVRIGFDYSF